MTPGRPGGAPPRPPSRPALNVAAAILGNALEFYDFTVYAVFATMIGRAFFPTSDARVSLLLSVATFGVGFIARPLGGIVIGAYADRFGRRPAMTLTILMMALCSGMIGVLPGYAQIGIAAPLLLVVARLIQGFSAGGEMGPATAFLLESAPAGRRCFFGSWQMASQNMGSILSGVLGVALAVALPADATREWGWRVAFLLGILIAPVGFFVRRNLTETLAAEDAHASMSAVLGDIIGQHWRKVLLCIFVISGATVTQYFFLYTTTYAITTLHYPQGVAMGANLTTGAFGVAFSLVGGVLADRYGLKTVAIVPRIIVTILLYPALLLVVTTGSPALFIAVVAVLMSFHAMSGGAAITIIPTIFPAATRTSGLAISYALGVTLFGGTAQVVFTWIIATTGDKLSWVWYIVAVAVICIVATSMIRLPDQRAAFARRDERKTMAAVRRA